MTSDLRESFQNIRKYNMRLNPDKCSFGVASGKFLGYMLTQRGIEADPSQIKAIQEIKPPSTLKEVQTLTGCIAALRRFIPQASKRCIPFFQAIKSISQSKKLQWTEECQASLEELRKFSDYTPPSSLNRSRVKAYVCIVRRRRYLSCRFN